MRARGYLIEKYDDMGAAHTCARLVEEARRAGMDLEVVGVRDCVLDGGQVLRHGQALPRRDFAVIRQKRGHVRDAVCGLCDRSYNELGAFSRFVDKYEQVRALSSAAFEVPRWRLVTCARPFEEVSCELGLPFVAKGLASSQGDQVHLVRDEAGWRSLAERYGEGFEMLAEELVSTSLGRDVRALCVRGEVVGCMERRSREGFRANVALGAEVRALEPDADVRRAAEDVFRQTGLDVVGLDLLYGASGYCLCEINVMPGIGGIEAATGINVAARIMGAIRDDLGEAS